MFIFENTEYPGQAILLFSWSFQSQHELKPVDHCEYAYQLKKDEVCINPYHYNKIDSPGESIQFYNSKEVYVIVHFRCDSYGH